MRVCGYRKLPVHHLPIVRLPVFIRIAQEHDIRQREHQHASPDWLNAARPVHLGKHRPPVHPAIAVGVLEHDHPA